MYYTYNQIQLDTPILFRFLFLSHKHGHVCVCLERIRQGICWRNENIELNKERKTREICIIYICIILSILNHFLTYTDTYACTLAHTYTHTQTHTHIHSHSHIMVHLTQMSLEVSQIDGRQNQMTLLHNFIGNHMKSKLCITSGQFLTTTSFQYTTLQGQTVTHIPQPSQSHGHVPLCRSFQGRDP